MLGVGLTLWGWEEGWEGNAASQRDPDVGGADAPEVAAVRSWEAGGTDSGLTL